MASGFGAFGGVGRCYEIWSDLVKCQQRTPISLECIDFRDDYIECLHGKKEFEREKAIKTRRDMLIKQGKYNPEK